ncbi:MAG: mycofactocin biosynthesis peptidyl-dipeptidase MftE [Candidatus Dormibacteraeota bacterium]|nr:mycofactocin biosynthesis peptidyl-dipeptidase MftE [Candidatus Dormibacteraeota bacterium]
MPGQDSRESRLDRLTWPEIAARRRSGWDTVLLPLGATEQHGPHLPLGTDTLIAEELARRACRLLGRTFAAPVLPVGASDEHRHFAGTLSLDHATLADTIIGIASRLVERGFAHVAVFSAHGGNVEAMARAEGQAGRGVTILSRHAPAGADGGLHAGKAETSMLLAVAPSAVHMEAAAPGRSAPMGAASWELLRRDGVRALAANGVLGDPTGATATHGEELLDEAASGLASAVSAARARLDSRV